MMKADYPLKFEPNVHEALWGREEWLVSNHPRGMGVIANGALKGKPLGEVFPEFPLLIKVIDAKTRLSVQVHPNERTRELTGGDPKTEMWCMLDDGFIYAGLKPGVTADDVAAAVKDGRFEELMVRHQAKAGEAFFIPGGLVHAIGDGVKLFEVQQSSDTTYRLYDWNRVGADGKGRPLHVDQAKIAIDYTLPAPSAAKSVECAFFRFGQLEIDGARDFAAEDRFTVIYVRHGSAIANGVELAEGECALIPPGLAWSLATSGCGLFVART